LLELSEDDQAVARRILTELFTSEDMESPTLSELWSLDYDEKPVDIDTFIEDPYYCGNFTDGIYPKWREDLRKVFAPGSQVYEWIFTGAIGTGKTTVAMLAKEYVIYRNACLKNPQRYYGLLDDSLIVYGVYSVTKAQAYDVGYHKLRTFLEATPWFQEKFPFTPRIITRVVFSKCQMQVIPGSREFHALGQDILTLFLDEVNFMQQGAKNANTSKEIGQAYQIYNAAKTRLKSRFMRPGGQVPGMMFLVSSKRSQTDFLEQHLKACREEIANGHVYVSDYPLWHVKSPKLYTLPRFNVEIGDVINPPRILESDDVPRKGAEVISVPGEFKVDFERDVDRSLRDIAGIATYGVMPYIRDRNTVLECVDKKREHPFTRTSIVLDDRMDFDLNEFFNTYVMFRVEHSRYTPILNPGAPRFAHLDLAKNGDCAGLGISHVAGLRTLRRQRRDATFYDSQEPEIVVDLMLQILPPAGGGEIDLSRIRSFIISLRDMGLPITKVTCDGWQSMDTMQIMRKAGFDSKLLSVDRNDEAYGYLRGAITERRINYYQYAPFIDEVCDLERDPETGKVDHPDGGSKDVADGVAGSVHSCSTDPTALHYDTLALVSGSTRPLLNVRESDGPLHNVLNREELLKELRRPPRN